MNFEAVIVGAIVGVAAGWLVRRWLAVPFAHIFGVEHAAGRPLPPGGDTRRYGSSALTFYRSTPP